MGWSRLTGAAAKDRAAGTRCWNRAGAVPAARSTAAIMLPSIAISRVVDAWDQAEQLVVLVVLLQVLVLEQLVDEPSMTSLASE